MANLYLPDEIKELLHCAINWGPGLKGPQMNARLKRIICLDCGICIGSHHDMGRLPQKLNLHRHRNKHQWTYQAAQAFLEQLEPVMATWVEEEEPVVDPALAPA